LKSSSIWSADILESSPLPTSLPAMVRLVSEPLKVLPTLPLNDPVPYLNTTTFLTSLIFFPFELTSWYIFSYEKTCESQRLQDIRQIFSARVSPWS
jgi:hypothetical protein